MKWVFMQPCTQFKLMLSLSTDRICNQSTTRGPSGTSCSNEIWGKTEKPQRIEPASVHTFYYKFPTFMFCFYYDAWWALTRSIVHTVSPPRAPWSLIVKRKEAIFREDFFFLWGFSIHARQKGKLTKCQQLNAEMHGQGSVWHHTPINITWGRTMS